MRRLEGSDAGAADDPKSSPASASTGTTTAVNERREPGRPSRTSPRRRTPDLASVIGVAVALLAGSIGLRSIGDNSFFTHLETGRLLLESGVPHNDPYSFTAAGAPWVVQSWLASLVFALADRVAGGVGIRLLTFALVAVTLWLAWRLTAPARTLLPRLAIIGLLIVVSSNFWVPRPLLLGIALFAALLVVAQEHRDPRWAVPLLWVWVNSHGSFPLGLVALGALALGERLDGKDPKPTLRVLAWAAVGTVLGAIGPVGPQLLWFPVQLLGRMDILSLVVEWQSPNFSQASARAFLLMLVVAIVALVRHPRYRAAIPLVVFAAAALAGLRNIPLAALMFVPGIAIGFRKLGNVRGDERGPVALGIGAIVAVVVVFVAATLLAQPSYDLSSYPVDALAWMEQNGLGPTTRRVATQDTTGNAIELLQGPSAKVFLDDRYDMYPIDVMKDYLVLHAGAPGWQDVLRRHRIDCVLWSTSEVLPQLLAESPDWVRRYQDASSTVSCRRDLT